MSAPAGVLPELAQRYVALERAAAARGLAFRLARWAGAAVRDAADTATAMRHRDVDYGRYLLTLPAGKVAVPKLLWRVIAPFGSSYHNYGASFDVEMIRGTLAQLGALAAAVGLVWGGRNDSPHFRLPITLLEAKARWLALGNIPGVAFGGTAVQVGAIMTVALIGGLAIMYGRGRRA